MDNMSFLPEEELDDDVGGLLSDMIIFERRGPFGVGPMVTSSTGQVATAVAVLVLAGAVPLGSLPRMARKAELAGNAPVGAAIRRAHRVLLREWAEEDE